jgi:hypothetical protein
MVQAAVPVALDTFELRSLRSPAVDAESAVVAEYARQPAPRVYEEAMRLFHRMWTKPAALGTLRGIS